MSWAISVSALRPSSSPEMSWGWVNISLVGDAVPVHSLVGVKHARQATPPLSTTSSSH